MGFPWKFPYRFTNIRKFVKFTDISDTLQFLNHWTLEFQNTDDSLGFANIGDSLTLTDTLDNTSFNDIPDTLRFTEVKV